MCRQVKPDFTGNLLHLGCGRATLDCQGSGAGGVETDLAEIRHPEPFDEGPAGDRFR